MSDDARVGSFICFLSLFISAFVVSFKYLHYVGEFNLKIFWPIITLINCTLAYRLDNLDILKSCIFPRASLRALLISWTFSGKFAYRTHMHQFGFALPTNLASLGAVCLIVTLCVARNKDICAFHNITLDLFFEEFLFRNWDEFFTRWYIWLWLIWLMSQIWITMHLWTSENERLALTERIFSTITYDSLMIDQCLALNRRTQNENTDQEEHEEQDKDAQLSVKS